MVKALKYLIPLWFGVVLYAVFSFALGAKGISAYNQLMDERDKEQANVQALAALNADLNETRASFSTDKENYSVYARELGFARPGEQFIRIVGLGNPVKPLRSPGEIVYAIPPIYVSDRVLQYIAFFAAITLLISMVVYDFLRFLRRRAYS